MKSISRGKTRQRTGATRFLVVCAAGLLISLVARAQSTDQSSAERMTELQRLVTDGSYPAAYALGKSMPEAQGDAQYDFLFGVAAVNVGRTVEAVLALERHLGLVPGNDRARLDLARAYFELGDFTRARQEFEFVLRYNPPADVRNNIQRYLDSMQTRDSVSNRSDARLYLETGWGDDSNANVGTYNSTVNTMGGTNKLIDPTSRAVSSAYAWISGGGKWARQVSSPFSVFAGGDFDNKLNESAPQFNISNVTAYAGFSMVSGAVLYRLSVADSIMSVYGSRYRASLSSTGEMQYAVGDGLTLNGSLQYAEQSFSPDSNYRDSTMETMLLGVQKAFSGDYQPVLALQLSQGKEDNQSKRLDLSQDISTVRLIAMARPAEKLGVALTYSVQRSDYLGMDIGFGSWRKDELTTLDLSASYAVDRNWVLKAELQSSENVSNQALYAYRRNLGALKLRYTF